MIFRLKHRRRAATAALIAATVCTAGAQHSPATEERAPAFAGVESLGLPAATAKALTQALDSQDYVGAERVLLPEIQQQDKSDHTAKLLSFMGGLYYLDRDYLHAAVAWKKSEAIEPLEPAVQFSLAMSYVELRHPDWAREVLRSLSAHDPKNAIYPYWLGRLDYDAHEYSGAIAHLQQAIALDPRLARAYDNLGLCYFHQNQNDLAVQSFRRAIDLEANEVHPSPWPWFNLAVTLQLLNRTHEAETDLRRATQLDPAFAQAYYELGNVLDQEGRTADAIAAWRDAARANSAYPEPHVALARAYRKQGDAPAAQKELQTYLRLRGGETQGAGAH